MSEQLSLMSATGSSKLEEHHMNSRHSPEFDSDRLINASDFATMLGISPRTLWRLLSAGQVIQPVRIGGNTRWRLHEVRQWITSGCPIQSNQ